MKILRQWLAGIFLIAAMLACSLPAREQVAPPGDVQTAAALTVQAMLTVPVTPSATEPQSIIAVTPSPTATAVTATITPTFSIPMLIVKEQTNCRKGPGEAYEIVFTYLPNKKLTILGRYDPGNFWLVKSDESPTGQCWLWGEYVEVIGSYWVVSSVTPPPTSTKAPPQAPSIQEWNYSCSGGILTFTVKWTDQANGESGYRIYRNGEAIAELPANSTSYVDSSSPSVGESVEYYINVYGPYGTANSSTLKMTC